MNEQEIFNIFIQRVDLQFEIASNQIKECFEIKKDLCEYSIQLFEVINDCASEKDRFIEELFQSGPQGLTNSNGLHHKLYYDACLYTHNKGLELIRLPMDLANSLQNDV